MKWRCQHGFPSFKQEKVRRGGWNLLCWAAVGLGRLSGLVLGLKWKNIKKVPVRLTVYTAKIADMGLY